MISINISQNVSGSAMICMRPIDIPMRAGYRLGLVYSKNKNQQFENRRGLLHLPSGGVGADQWQGAAEDHAQSGAFVFIAPGAVG